MELGSLGKWQFPHKSQYVTRFIHGDFPLLLMWLIFSYKAWGALLGRRLAERGIIVACIDYRCWCLKRILWCIHHIHVIHHYVFNLYFFYYFWVLTGWFLFAWLSKFKYGGQKFPSRNNKRHGQWCFWGDIIHL